MEKQKSKFQVSRPVMFQRFYAKAELEIAQQLGRAGGLRRRGRALARKQARMAMRKYRQAA